MFHSTRTFLLVAFFSILTVACSSELTQTDVENLISDVDSAIENLNAEGVGNKLSNDVEIVMNINFQGHEQTLRPSKQEYLLMLKQGWGAYSGYKYERSNLVIDIQDNRAFVSAEVKETMTMNGTKMSGETKEDITIEFVDGAPLITKIIGHSKI